MKSPRTRPSVLVGQWFGSAWGTPIFSPQTAPTSLSAVASITSVDVSFTAPTNNGGSAITNYEYSFNNSTWTALSPADSTSPVTISGLTASTAYTIYLRAVNTVGSSPASSGLSVTTLANVPSSVEYLVVAGGGGGSGGTAGGGGAGGMLTGSLATSGGIAYSVTVAGGGAGAAGVAGNGGNSAFHSITSIGGGRGATSNPNTAAGSGGSGGGGAYFSGYGNQGPGSGTAGQGNSGGAQIISGDVYQMGGGGGGGAGGAGGSPNGGTGASSSITGSAVTRAGGGGGARYDGYASGAGGAGGGGNGGAYGGSAGSANTGGGGGAGWYYGNYPGAAGGSGIVIIAYPSSFPAPTSIGAGLTYSVSTTSRSGYRVYSFTAGTGTITF